MALPKFENIVMQETVPLKKLSDGRAAETKSPAGAPADVIGFGSRFSKIWIDSIVRILTLISVLVSQFFYLIPPPHSSTHNSRSMRKNLKAWNSST
jgi:hypothetical protein